MADVISSPNMSMPVPIPGLDIGPDWANNLVACLSILDGHTHVPGSGNQITPSAINISSDLTFNNTNNLTNLRSLRFFPNLAPLALAADLGCLYESGVDLYYNDGSGNQIRITQGGNVTGSAGTITGLPSGTASAAFVAGSGTFVFQQASSTGANMDIGTIILRYPGSYPTPSGNYIALEVPSSIASGYALTLPALPASNNAFMTMSTAGVISTAITVDNSTLAISGSNVVVKPLGITTAQVSSTAAIEGLKLQTSTNFVGPNNTFDSKNVVVSNTTSVVALAIVRGIVDANGTILQGEGFAISAHSTGSYTIDFSPDFGNTPAVTVTIAHAGANLALLAKSFAAAPGSCVVELVDFTATPRDNQFHFIAIGPRAP